MPALSFQEDWLDKLLSGIKQQTTRLQTDRIKVGDICHINTQQRRRIIDNPTRKLTEYGRAEICSTYAGSFYHESYYAHFLGKVKITEVCDFFPYDMFCFANLEDWACADGFDTFEDADVWFVKQYGEEWDLMHWTVIRWDGWLERYFEPEVTL